MQSRFDVVAVGHAIVDVLAHVDDAFLTDHGIAKGAMTLIDSFRAAGTRVTERDVDPAELDGASEVFLTNALIGAWPVRRLAKSAWPAGPFARRAQGWIATW